MKRNKFDKKPKKNFSNEGDEFMKHKRRPPKNKQGKNSLMNVYDDDDYDEEDDLDDYDPEDSLDDYYDEEDY